MSALITYRRTGRTMKATGTIIEADPKRGLFKVKPAHPRWRSIWVGVPEIQQAAGTYAAKDTSPAPIPALAAMVAGLQQLLDRQLSL
jgi:hypothetical protein